MSRDASPARRAQGGPAQHPQIRVLTRLSLLLSISCRFTPLPCAEAAVRTVSDEKGVEEIATPSVEQLEILAIVAYFGQASRALVERFRGEESHSLLERLVARGLLARVRDKKALGAPYVYSVTAKALRAAGFATPEAMRAAVAQEISAEQQMRVASAVDETAGEGAPAQRAAS